MRNSMLAFAAGAFFISAPDLMAQSLSYTEGGYQTGGTTTNEARSGSSQTFLDSDFSDLPSTLTFNRWSDRLKDLFEKYDTDNDRVWSELDLVDVNNEDAISWAENEVSHIFTVWLPDLNEHLQNIEEGAQTVAEQDDMLLVTQESTKSVQAAFKSIGLLGSESQAVYVKGVPEAGGKVLRVGEVAERSRSWIEVSVPFELQIASLEGVQSYPYNATVIAMMKFPDFRGDETFALWDIRVGDR